MRPTEMSRSLRRWQARKRRCKLRFADDHSGFIEIETMAPAPSLAGVLLVLCLSRPAPTGEPASVPRATTSQVRQAVDRAITYLQNESADWLNMRKCAACHHVPMPLWALGEAQRQGYAIDEKFVADTVESLLGSRDTLMASKIFPNPTE